MASYTTKIIIPFLDEKIEVSAIDEDEFRSVHSALKMKESLLRQIKGVKHE